MTGVVLLCLRNVTYQAMQAETVSCLHRKAMKRDLSNDWELIAVDM